MSKINRHPVRRTAAGVLAGALALSGAVAAAVPANAATGFALDRIAGNDRYATSAQIAAAFGTTSGAILASGETGHVVDALSANFLAGVRGVPVLLTTKNSVPAAVMAQLNALTGTKNVTIVGGPAAVSTEVETSLKGMGFTVDRLDGDSRYSTSEAIIKAGASSANSIGLVASGTSFPDALAGGPLSYAGKHPVFLTAGGRLPQDSIDAMVAAGTKSVIILGGTAAVPTSVETQLSALGITVANRLGGTSRSDTSRLIANYLLANGFVNTTFDVASGAPRGEGADALSGAALSGKTKHALLVTDTENSAAPVTAFTEEHKATLTTTGRVYGGPAAVSTALESALERVGSQTVTNQTFTVTPSTAATLSLVENESSATAAVAATDNRSYSVSTAAAGQTHTIVLVPAANVTVGTNGSVTFREDAATNLADLGSVAARISEVNGVQIASGSQQVRATAVPVAGTITFTIEGNAAESVVPVVFFDANSNNRLELNDDNTPVTAEAFGVGGATTFINPAAASQVLGATAVQSVNKGANQFDASDLTFTYDANDTFSVADAATPGTFIPATLDEFEARLSRGDDVATTYSSTPGASSSFQLVDLAPTAPASATADAGAGANSNDITVTVPISANVDSVIIQRATVTGGTDDNADGTVGTYANVATVVPSAAQRTAGEVTYVDDNVAVGVYRYRAAYVSDGQTTGFTADTANEASTAPAADSIPPQATATTRTADNGFAGVLDSGDTFTIRANETLAAPANGSTIRVTDGDGTVADLVCGTNATCSLNGAAIAASPTGPNAGAAAGTVLTVTITAAPTVVTPGSTAGVQYPATIANTAGINDTAGNRLSLSSPDLSIN